MSNPRATFTNRNKTALFKEGNIPIVFENRNPTIVFKMPSLPTQGIGVMVIESTFIIG